MIKTNTCRPNLIFILLVLFPLISFSQISINSGDFSYSQDFNSLPAGANGAALNWTNNQTLSGWHQNYWGSTKNDYSFQAVPRNDTNGTIVSGGFSTNLSARFYNIGHADSTNRSLGMFRGNSLYGAIGAVFKNDSGSALGGFNLGYTGKQFRRGGTIQTALYFEYQVVSDITNLDIDSASSNWTRVDSLQFDSPKFDGGGTNLDGEVHKQELSAQSINIGIGTNDYVVVRWYQDRTSSTGSDATGTYHALGIDDVSFRTIIPEPSSYALIFGVLVLTGIFIRKKLS